MYSYIAYFSGMAVMAFIVGLVIAAVLAGRRCRQKP